MIHLDCTGFSVDGLVAFIFEAYPPWNEPVKYLREPNTPHGIIYELISLKQFSPDSYSCEYRELIGPVQAA